MGISRVFSFVITDQKSRVYLYTKSCESSALEDTWGLAGAVAMSALLGSLAVVLQYCCSLFQCVAIFNKHAARQPRCGDAVLLQHVAECCIVLLLQWACCSAALLWYCSGVAVYCSVLQHVAVSRQQVRALWQSARARCAVVCCSVLRRVAAFCSVLQCVAVCCSVLQRVAVCWVYCNVMQCLFSRKGHSDQESASYNMVWCNVALRRVLRCVAVCRSMLQCIAVCCGVLKYGVV